MTDMYSLQKAPEMPDAGQSSPTVGIDSKDNLDDQRLERHTGFSERKYCTECGNPIGIHAKFCIRCGNKQN